MSDEHAQINIAEVEALRRRLEKVVEVEFGCLGGLVYASVRRCVESWDFDVYFSKSLDTNLICSDENIIIDCEEIDWTWKSRMVYADKNTRMPIISEKELSINYKKSLKGYAESKLAERLIREA